MARLARRRADRGGGDHARQPQCFSRLVGVAAGRRHRAADIGAFGLAVPEGTGEPALRVDRIDQLSALSLALAAFGVFRHHQVRAADIDRARTGPAGDGAAGVGNLPLCRDADPFWQARARAGSPLFAQR